MNNKTRFAIAVGVILPAVLLLLKPSADKVPSDLRDAVNSPSEQLGISEAAPVIAAPEAAEDVKGYVQGKPPPKTEWVSIPGGSFLLGTDDASLAFEDAKPIREIEIKPFLMSKTPVTVDQYAECVKLGKCTEPGAGDYCNWGKPGLGNHPVNCVDWNQARIYSLFKGARLPSEAEWEYAATSGGRNQKYPWGNEEPTCDRAVMFGNGAYGCGTNGIMPVCSKPDGNTAQGLCDMAGNVFQWVRDLYQESYLHSPIDGSAQELPGGTERVTRGGSFTRGDPFMRAEFRFPRQPGERSSEVGFRIAKDLK